MLIPRFYIYTQSTIVGDGLSTLLINICPKSEISIITSPKKKLERFDDGISVHFVFISPLQRGFYAMAQQEIIDKSNIKIVLCPMVNDLGIIPLVKLCQFDALISLEAINNQNLPKLLTRITDDNLFIDEFYSTEIIKTKYDRIGACLKTISARETEVLEKIVQDKPNGQIAHELGLSIRTVNAHKRNLLKKFNANSMEYVIDVYSRFGEVYTDFNPYK